MDNRGRFGAGGAYWTYIQYAAKKGGRQGDDSELAGVELLQDAAYLFFLSARHRSSANDGRSANPNT
jgi:hypothetical protein